MADFRQLYDFTEAGRDDLKVPADDFNVTKRIDTLLVNPLHQLPLGSFGGNNAAIRATGRELNLAFRNLTRAGMVRLCSGQQLAERFGLQPLDADEILAGNEGHPSTSSPTTRRSRSRRTLPCGSTSCGRPSSTAGG